MNSKFASVYDVNVNKVILLLVWRLAKPIEKYKREIASSIEADTNNEVPVTMVYRELLKMQKKPVIHSSSLLHTPVSALFSVEVEDDDSVNILTPLSQILGLCYVIFPIFLINKAKTRLF